MIVDKACFERGCACYDDRVDGPGVEVLEKKGEKPMSNVIPFNGITKLDLDPDIVLENTKGKLEGFVICGYDHMGIEYFASTYADGGDVLWLLERMKLRLLNIAEEKNQ